MSTPAIMPGAKAENAVYLAFGLTLSLYFINIFRPELFSTDYTRELVALAAFGASLIGATFFYTKPDRLILRLLKRWVLSQRGQWMGISIAEYRVYYRIWHVAMVENWPTITEESEESISSVLDSAELYDDMWRFRGGAYFIIGVLLLGSTLELGEIMLVTISVPFSSFVSIAICAIVLTAMIYNAYLMPEKVASLASMRIFKDVRSMTKARKDFGQDSKTWVINDFEPTIPGTDGTAELFLNELSEMVIDHDWNRFCRRFAHLIKSIKTWIYTRTESQQFQKIIDSYLLESITRKYIASEKKRYEYFKTSEKSCFHKQIEILDSWQDEYGERDKPAWMTHPYNDIISVLKHIDSLSNNTWRNHLQKLISGAFDNLESEYFKQLNDDAVAIFRNWCDEGIVPSCSTAVNLVPEYASDSITISILSKIDDNEKGWPSIRRGHLEFMMAAGLEFPVKCFKHIILRTNSPERLDILRFAITNKDFTIEGWTSILRKEGYIRLYLPLMIELLKDSKIKPDLISLLEGMRNSDDTNVQTTATRLLPNLLKIS
jgi:hypothetical protein